MQSVHVDVSADKGYIDCGTVDNTGHKRVYVWSNCTVVLAITYETLTNNVPHIRHTAKSSDHAAAASCSASLEEI